MERFSTSSKSYGWQELALLYHPQVTPKTASKRLHSWIKFNPELQAALLRNGWRKGCRILTPRQTELLFFYLGAP